MDMTLDPSQDVLSSIHLLSMPFQCGVQLMVCLLIDSFQALNCIQGQKLYSDHAKYEIATFQKRHSIA